MTEGAVAAAVAAAKAQGVRCEHPVVLRDAWHVLVHLQPFAIVARVSTGTATPGGPSPADVVRELGVATHAARLGAPVVPPADALDPGPHWRGEHVVTFWRYVRPSGEVDPREAGRGLRTIHEALGDYHEPLPSAGHPADLDAMLATLDDSEHVELLRAVASRPPELEGQALHGDAHLGNCISSSGAVLWHDFETACSGPREYDLAALVLRDLTSGGYPPARSALAAYGVHDSDLLDAVVPVYAAWVFASLLTALPRRPVLEPVVEERLRWLRAYVAGG